MKCLSFSLLIKYGAIAILKLLWWLPFVISTVLDFINSEHLRFSHKQQADMKAVSVICTVVLLALTTVQGLRYPQYMQIYNYTSCLANPESFIESATNLTQRSDLATAKSWSVRGLWRLEFSNDGGSVTTLSQESASCLSPVQIENHPLESVIRLVPGDLDDSVLTLFELEWFEGESNVVYGVGTTFEQPLNVSSWAFTGAENFTVYEGVDFTGTSACLLPDSYTAYKGWGISAVMGSGITVQSVKLGCDANASRSIHGDLKTAQKNLLVHGNEKHVFQVQPIPDVKWQ